MTAIRSIRSFGLPSQSSRGSLSRLAFLFLFLISSATLGSPAAASQTASPTDDTYRQATAAMREGRLDDAAAGFQAVLKANPALAEADFNLGLVYQQQGKYEDAIASFRKALALKPRLRGANLFAGLCEYRLNHLEQAVTYLQKETALYPNDAAGWMWLGVVRLTQEKPEEAVAALDKAAKLDPDNADILYHRGRAHLLVSKDSYTKMFKLDPNSWRVHQVLAQTNAESEHHDEAVVEYLEAIKLAPTQPGLHEELGSEYRILAKFPEAEAAFRKELEIDPSNVLARYKLGVIMVEKGNAVEGKELIEGALKQRPELRNSDYNLGRAEMLLGNDQAALADFKKAITGNSEPEIVRQSWYQLGTILRRMHRVDEAQQAFAVFQKLKDQEEEDAQRRKQKLIQRQQELNEPTQPPPGEAPKPQ